MAGYLTGQKDAYEYLGGSIEEFPMGKEMCELIDAQGFREADARPLCCGVATIYTAEAV
jgi:demethylmenaquinone methyltransferase/2-methoxy-6-polyprenyl-1,4-benzoquinol methylase